MEREILYNNALAGILSAKSELRERAKRLSRHNRTILHIASKDGSIEQVEYILKEFASNNFLVKLDSKNETALHVAASFGHTEVVKGLIKAAKRLRTSSDDDPDNLFNCVEAFVRQANEQGNTALHLAVMNGNLDCAKLLAEADPGDSHIQNNTGDTPIYLAAKLGYNDTVMMFCKVCTSLTFDGPEGSTALHAAIRKLPQAKEEDKNVVREPTRSFSLLAAKEEDRDVVRELIDAAKRSFPSAIRLESFVRQADKNMDTALHLAVLGKHLDVVDLILKADLTYPHEDKNKESKTPIYIAAEQGYKDIVKLLCKTSEFGYTTRGPENRTALHAAILGRDAGCVKTLLGRAQHLVIDVDDKGWTPLHYAAFHKFDSIIDDIIAKQKFVGYEFVDGDNVTPLCLAAQEGHTSTVKKLMTSLPSLSCSDVNCDGQNILHIAASRSDKEMVQCILKCCPKEYTSRILNQKDSNGNTPLHLLIREGCFVAELINHKEANTMTRNNKNWTPLDMLYFQEKIKVGQLQIKKAVYGSQANNQHRKFWGRIRIKGKSNSQESDITHNQQWNSRNKSTKGKLNTEESLVPPSTRSKIDAIFKMEKKKVLKEELEHYRHRTSTQIIVTALITTVTFTVGFTLPGGYHQSNEDDKGLALLSKKAAFSAFMVTDALALALSTSSLFLYFISTMYQNPHRVSILNAASTVLNIFSIIAMMLTFLTGTYVVLSKTPALAISVCVIICLFFLLVIVLSIQMIIDRKDQEIEKIEV